MRGTCIDPEFFVGDRALMSEQQRKRQLDLDEWFDTTVNQLAEQPGWEKCIEETARGAGIPANLIRAIIAVESQGDPRAQHRNSDESIDYGIMQINSSNRGISVDDAYAPLKAIPWAVENVVRPAMQTYQAQNRQRWHKILEAYNRGYRPELRSDSDFSWLAQWSDGDGWDAREGLLYSDRVLYEFWRFNSR